MAIKHKLTVTLVAFFVIALGVAVYVEKTEFQFSVYPPFKQINKGLPEADVIRILGQPLAKREITDIYDISYKITGYTFRAFLAQGTIYVYQGGHNVCYVLIREGRVSDFFIGNR